MGKLATGIMTLWLGAAGAGGAIAAEPKQGPTMSTADLPAAVKSTFDKQAKGAPVQELRRESFNGLPVYSGEIVKNGIRRPVRYHRARPSQREDVDPLLYLITAVAPRLRATALARAEK